MEIFFYFFVFLPFPQDSAADSSFLYGPAIHFIQIPFFKNGKKWTVIRGIELQERPLQLPIRKERLGKRERIVDDRSSDEFRQETQMKGK